MPNRFASFLLASALACFAIGAAAQPPAPVPADPNAAGPTTVAPVTVEAAAKPKVVEKQAHSFVQSYAAAPNAEVDQIVRWRDPVCAQIEGLPADQGAMIKARIEDVAKAVGLPKARATCNVNVEIVFTTQPQKLMDSVAQRRETMLGYYHRHERDKLKIVTHPIQAWYVTATLGGGGSNAAMFYGLSGVQTMTEVVDDPENPPPTSCGENLHFTNCLQGVFKNVFVVADIGQLQGKDLGLLADYLVMLSLSQPRSLDTCYALASVVDLFAKSCTGRDAPDGLTSGDAAYLTALYQADLKARKDGEQGDIANRMAAILTKAAAAKR